MNTDKKLNHKLIGFLFTPSWLSGLLVITVAFLLVGGVVGLTHLSGSDIEAQYTIYRENKAQEGILDTYRTDKVHALISAAPLMVFWSLMGLVVYLLASNIVGSINEANEMRSRLEYINADRNRMLRTAASHFLIRLVVIAVWIPYILFFFHHVVPYIVTLGTVAAQLTISTVPYALLGTAVMAIALHLHVIMFRLVLLKPRVLSRALYVG